MKILLVRVASINMLQRMIPVRVEPLGLEYLAAVASEQGCSWRIHDDWIDGRDIRPVLQEYQPELVALSGCITGTVRLLRLASQVKLWNRDTIVLAGGAHAEMNWEDFQHPAVDGVVFSGGALTFAAILRELLAVGEWKLLPGVSAREADNEWKKNQPAMFDPGLLPQPERSHYYKNCRKFHYMECRRIAVVKTAYGCPYRCRFCYCCHMNGGKYQYRDAADVVQELEALDCEAIWLLDDTFLIGRDRIEDFIRLLSEKGINKRFIIYSRADHIAAYAGLLEKFRDAGLQEVILGLEATDAAVLGSYDKGASVDDNIKALSILKSLGIRSTGLFIVHPDASRADFRKVHHWIRRYGADRMTVSLFTPLPGTTAYSEYQGRLSSRDKRKYDFLHLLLPASKMNKWEFLMRFWLLQGEMLLRSLRLPVFLRRNIKKI